MGGHDTAHPCVNGILKGPQFDRVQPDGVVVDNRKRKVRVRIRVTVAGKVLAGCDAAVVLNAAHERRAQVRHAARVFAKRAHVDDGVVRIVVDVQDRRERDMNPDGARLNGSDSPHFVGQRAVVRRAHRHE